METEIQNFLFLTAKWSPRWFNKPKFHILLHLPHHVRRFGPAILFATESFESFNGVIRAKSIHSNRHAPSRDIAHQFAQCNRIRHALSGGRIPLGSDPSKLAGDMDLTMVREATTSTSRTDPIVMAGDAGMWRLVGRGPLKIIENDEAVQSFMGLGPSKKKDPGQSHN